MSVFWHRPKVMRVGACLNEPSLNILRTVLMDSFSTYDAGSRKPMTSVMG